MEVLKLSSRCLIRFGANSTTGLRRGGVMKFVPRHEISFLLRTRILPCSIRGLATKADSSPGVGESSSVTGDEEFEALDIIRSRQRTRGGPRKKFERKPVPPPRYLKMPTDQDWPSVWPTPKTFHPASVPLPLHQGYVKQGKGKSPPNKFANLELMKLPNFLHLTPPAIKRHCEAIKKFCTPWPEELKDDYVLDNLFPIEIINNDYCHSLPSIRDPRARIVTLRVKLSFFKFDEHAKDKFLRLVGKRYNPQTDELTLVTDCCPLKKQNYDYAMYLMTALYHESWNNESWEEEKSEADMEKYVWEGSRSHETLQQLVGPEKLNTETVENYKNALEKILNEGESNEVISDYGKSVRQLLNLPISVSPELISKSGDGAGSNPSSS